MNTRKRRMISRWVLVDLSFKTCISVPSQPGHEANKESIQMMNMRLCRGLTGEPSLSEGNQMKGGPETLGLGKRSGRM